MAELLEIRWHGRGGQGAKTAATFLAASAIASGKYAQGFPEYGPERRGAPVKGFTRISDKPVKLHCAVENPKMVVVLDETLIEVVDVAEGLPKEGIILVNSNCDPQTLRDLVNFHTGKVATVDATTISIEELGKAIPNTPMLGALIKVANVLPIDSILEDITKKFEKKFSQKIIQGNINAIRRAYEEVKVDDSI
ncbi:2-oxoacid:acceptor oxidoreductase family protein [bacterium]|nr:2-oxoacid:acceptor oxidoreductase family protein [bacterium]